MASRPPHTSQQPTATSKRAAALLLSGVAASAQAAKAPSLLLERQPENHLLQHQHASRRFTPVPFHVSEVTPKMPKLRFVAHDL